MKPIAVKKTRHGIHKSIEGVSLSVTTSGKTLLSPGAKTVHSPVFVRVGDTVMAYGKYKVKKSTKKATNFINNKGPEVDIFVDTNLNARTFVDGKEITDKITMTGREWLRSINDDNGFTLMPRLVWRVVAVVILVIICLVVIL